MLSAVRRQIIITLILVMSFGLSACTGKSIPSSVHKTGERTVEPAPSSFVLSPKIVPDATIERFQVLAEGNNSIQSAEEIYKQRIKPLQVASFNLNTLTLQMNRGAQLMEIIRLYNNALLDLCEIEPKGSRCMSLLLDYESLVRHGCEAYMKGCALIEIFRDTSSSIDVWARVAQLETNDLELKKQRIYTGIGIAKGQRSIRFERMLLALAPEIEKKFNRRRKISRGNLLHFDEEEEEFHYRQMERLVRIPDMLGTTEDYRSYIRYLVEQSVARAATKRSRVQKVALKELGERGIIEEPWFQSVIEENLASNPSSYTAAYDNVNKNTKHALRVHGLKKKLEKDSVYYIINSLYMRVWDVDSVRSIWGGSKQDKDQLVRVIKDYVQVQFLSVVVRSHQRMGDFYDSSTKKGRAYMQNDMHRRALDVANEIRSYWKDYYDRIARVRDFSMYALDENINLLKELKIDVENINQTVKLYVSTPHMLMLAYKMLKDKFETQNWFGSISGKKIFNHIFMKGTASWFDYRADGMYYQWLNQTSLTLGMHFALRMEAFKFFKVEPTEFFSLISKQLMDADLEAARDRLTLFTMPARVYKTQYEELLNVCAEERRFSEWELTPQQIFKKRRHRNYSVTTTPKDFRLATLLYSSFGQIFYDFSTHNQNVQSNSPLRLYFRYNSTTHQNAINLVRLSLQSKIKILKNIMEIYKRYLVDDLQLLEDERKIDRILSPITNQIARANHFKRRFFSKIMMEIRSLFKDCGTLLIRRELDIQNALYWVMYEFYKQMYRDYGQIKIIQGKVAESDLSEEAGYAKIKNITTRYKVTHPDLPGYNGTDYFDWESGEFVVHMLDSLIRFSEFLAKGYKSDTFDTGPVNNGIRLIMPVAGMIKLQDYIDHPQRIKFQDARNEEEFAKKAMRYYRGFDLSNQSKFLVFWNKGHTWWGQFFIKEQLDMYLNVYKVGKLEIYDETAPECQFEEYDLSCESKVVTTEMEIDLIIRDTFRAYELLTVSDADRAALNLLGMSDRGQETNYTVIDRFSGEGETVMYGSVAKYLYHPKDRGLMGFFDYHNYVLNMENIGWNISFQLPWSTSFEGYQAPPYMPLMRARSFVYEFQDEKLLMMPIASKIRQILLDDVQSAVDNEFNRIFEFHDAILKLEADEDTTGIERSYPVDTTTGEYVTGPYLTPSRMQQTHDRLSGFHRDTFYMFDTIRKKEESLE